MAEVVTYACFMPVLTAELPTYVQIDNFVLQLSTNTQLANRMVQRSK
jgi:hypothetical protein